MEFETKGDEIDVSGLDPRLERELEKADLKNSLRILLADPSELRKLGNFTESDIELLKIRAANAIFPRRFITANEAQSVYSERWKTIAMDCAAIDSILGGGIPVRGITELYGVSGAGKTQFCLQLAITVQYPEEYGGMASGCVYICTEDRFPSKRLQQLVPQFPCGKDFDGEFLKNAADHIFVDHIPDVESMSFCLFKRLPALLRNRKIGLIVVDSIAAVFRSDYTNKQWVQRAKDLRLIGLQLHKVASQFNVAIICVNQVADSLELKETIPALGLVWANIVTTKLQLLILEDKQRLFRVVSSPQMPSSSCNYQITSNGVESR